jgi:hypothetical protein
MNDLSFDALARHAAGRVSRRASLMTVGAAGVATLVRPLSSEAKKKGKSAGKKAKQKCQKQTGQCTTFLNPICAGDPTCLAKAQECCGFAGSCDVNGFFDCVFAA